MIKITKKLLSGIFLYLLMFGFITSVSAASGYALAVGATLGSAAEDTTSFATYVKGQLSSMGYNAVARTGPTFSNLFMEIPGVSPIRWWLEADMLYFAGHGNYDNISFSTTGKTGPEYNVFIVNNAGYQYGPNNGMMGIGWFNLSKVKFIMFQACNTANQSYSNNITAYAQSRGAKTTVGWKTIIYRNAAADWQNRFWPRVVAGYTVQQAVDYANSFTYSTSSIVQNRVYGTTDAVINSAVLSLNRTVINEKSSDPREYVINQNIDSATKTSKEMIIGNLIKQYVNKDFINADYIVKVDQAESNEDVKTIYNYVLVINGIETNIGYTVFANADSSKITKIYDNTQNIDVSTIKSKANSISTKTISKTKIDSVKNTILAQNYSSISKVNYNSMNELYTSKNYNSDDLYHSVKYVYKIVGEHKYYDVVKDKLYHVLDVESKNEDSNALLYYSENIEMN